MSTWFPSSVTTSPLNPRNLEEHVISLCMGFLTTHVQHSLGVVVIELAYVICTPSLWLSTPPQVRPRRLLNSAPLTEVQTNKAPRGDKATSGYGQGERSSQYWCENDHYWERKKRCDGVDWAVDRLRKRKKKRWQDKTYDQWLRQWDKHLLSHCAGNGGLDLTSLSHSVEQAWTVLECTRGATWPMGVELWPHSLAHAITANQNKGGRTEQQLQKGFSVIPHTPCLMLTGRSHYATFFSHVFSADSRDAGDGSRRADWKGGLLRWLASWLAS